MESEPKKIAIQGIKGSFHHQVALDYFNQNFELDECISFELLVKSLQQKPSQEGVMALENSIAGSIIPNYALIDSNNLHIIGEHYIRFSLCISEEKIQEALDRF